MYAHFFKSPGKNWEVIITRSPELRGIYDQRDTGGNFVTKHPVDGKRMARAIANDYHAVCWNF